MITKTESRFKAAIMKNFFFALLSVLVFSLLCSAQTPTPTPAENDIVKISTTLIQIDVTVTDKKGKIVKGLKPEDFEIYENGKKQEITNLSFISNVREEDASEPTRNEKIPAPPPSVAVKPEQVRRTIALVVDDLTLSFESAYQVRRALKKFVDEQMQPGDLVAIIRTGAGIGALQQFTTDRRQLYAAIEKVRWNPLGSGGISAFAPLEAVPPTGEDPSEEEEEVGVRDPEVEASNFRESLFATGTLGAINYVVRGMQDLPGRKSVMLFSDGFALFTQDSLGFRESSRVLDSLRRLVDLANRASVVIYTMDARGLQTLGLTAADNTGGRSSEQMEQALSSRRARLFDTQEGLTYLAKQTGGLAVINQNDLSGGIRRMLDDQSYYLIGYEPDDETFDPKTRRFNKLEVKVKREGVSVRYRSGFFGISDEQIKKPIDQASQHQQIVNALTSPFAAGEILLRLNALFADDAKQGSYIRSLLHIRAQDLKFVDDANETKKAVFDVLAMNFGDNGAPVEQLGKTFTINVKENLYQKILKEGFLYDFAFPIKKPGAYQMRVAILDKATGKIGSANQFIEIPNIKKNRLTLSSIVLENLTFADWQKLAAGQTDIAPTDPLSNTALRQFKQGTVLNYAAAIYNPKLDAARKPNLTVQTRVFRDGKLYFEGKPNPIEIGGQTDLSGIRASGSLSLGTSMPPGEYVLQIVVTDNLAKEKRKIATQFVQFEIVP